MDSCQRCVHFFPYFVPEPGTNAKSRQRVPPGTADIRRFSSVPGGTNAAEQESLHATNIRGLTSPARLKSTPLQGPSVLSEFRWVSEFSGFLQNPGRFLKR